MRRWLKTNVIALTAAAVISLTACSGTSAEIPVGSNTAATTRATTVATPVPSTFASPAEPALLGPLHTNGIDTTIYDARNRPVRLAGFNWAGMQQGGRSDTMKEADVCGAVWRTPADSASGVTFKDFYSQIRRLGYNVIRLPISWNNLEPVAPVWNSFLNRYDHAFSTAYMSDLKSMVTQARAAGISVILDMHQDFWSPALHRITNFDGSPGHCEGVGMPRWLDPSIDSKATTTQQTDYRDGMNWFFENVPDPSSPVTRSTPWGLFYSAWDWVAYTFSAHSGYPAYQAVIGADILNEPYISYAGANPPPGESVLQAADQRLQAFYNSLGPAVHNQDPEWLLFFEDSTGGFNTGNPALRESPTMTAKPTTPGSWVYSTHIYNINGGTFDSGITTQDDFGINVAEADLANATRWHVPLFIGEFTIFSLGTDASTMTDADMAQTEKFLSWAKKNKISWTFWSYTSATKSMVAVDYRTGRLIDVIQAALATGL
ncbi:MAG: glycosidase [Pseudonocardiales bacterium]|nr:glycosidase [Pseudonocardiales bacterium]